MTNTTLHLLTPLIFAVAGLVTYHWSKSSKAQEIGRISFFVGLFWLVPALTQQLLKFPP